MNKFVKHNDDWKKDIQVYKNCHNLLLVIIPQFELIPFAMRVMNEFDKNKKKIIIYWSGLNASVINYLSLQENVIVYELRCEIKKINELLQQININNIRIDTFITHNFFEPETMYKLFIKDIDLVNICCYADGTRNNHKAEASEMSKLDIHTILNQNNIPNTLYFFGFIHNTYDSNNNIKILKYDENVYPKINNNLQKYKHMDKIFFSKKFDWKAYVSKYEDLQKANIDNLEKAWNHVNKYGYKENRDIFKGDRNLLRLFQNFCLTGEIKPIPDKYKENKNIGLILTRYLGTGDYQFKENVNIEKVMIDQIHKLFDNTTDNHIKLDRRINLNTSKLINVGKFTNFDDIISNSSTELMDTILLNDLEYCFNIKKVYCFDSSFPFIFQIPKLYNHLDKDIIIYTGFSKNIFDSVATQKCIDVLTKRTIELIININKLDLFDIYLKDKLIDRNETIDQIKGYNDCLFTLKLKNNK